MLTNADITVYHKTYNPQTRLDDWQKTHVKNVNWYAERAVSVGSDGLNAADTFIVRVPVSSALERLTVSVGDYVVHGLIEIDITRPAELAKFERFIVTAVRDNRRGSPNMRHWRIEGA